MLTSVDISNFTHNVKTFVYSQCIENIGSLFFNELNLKSVTFFQILNCTRMIIMIKCLNTACK